MASIQIPTALRQYAGEQDTIEVPAGTVDEAMSALVERYPDLRKHLYTEGGALRNFVNLYVNDEDVRYLERGKTPLGTGDSLMIIPAIAGGAETAMRPPLVQNGHTHLTRQELQRYSRHLLVPEIGLEGQERLKASSVLVIGAGGLGSPLALYLAAAGVGRIGIVDFDVVDYSNLQRQIIHNTSSVGRPKLESAKERILEVNPGVQVDLYDTALSSENALEIFAPYDVIVDGTDNFPTRYLTNDACVLLGKPNVYGSIFRFEGQASVFWAKEGPCYRCLYPEPPPPGLVPSCAEGGVLGVLPGLIGVVQATETIKLLLGIGESLVGRLLLYDALKMRFREMRLHKDPECPVCGEHPTVTELIDYQEFCGIHPHTPADDALEISAPELKARLDAGEPLVLVDVREPHEWKIAHLDGAKLIPLGQVTARAHELSTADEIVLYCKGGTRSERALQELQGLGFRKLKNLHGGINAWSIEVDPEVPLY